MAEGKLPPQMVQAYADNLVAPAATTPEQKAQLGANHVFLRAQLDHYGQTRPFNDSAFYQLKQQIYQTLPTDQRNTALAELNQKESRYQQGKRPDYRGIALGNASQQIAQRFAQGALTANAAQTLQTGLREKFRRDPESFDDHAAIHDWVRKQADAQQVIENAMQRRALGPYTYGGLNANFLTRHPTGRPVTETAKDALNSVAGGVADGTLAMGQGFYTQAAQGLRMLFPDNETAQSIADEYQRLSKNFDETRQHYRDFYGVDPQFANSFMGKLLTGAGQLVPQTVAAVLPGVGLLGLNSQGFQNAWDDAKQAAERKGEAFDPDKAYAYAATSGFVNALMSKAKVDAALKPWLKIGGGTALSGRQRPAHG